MINQNLAYWGGGEPLNNAQVFDGSFVYNVIPNWQQFDIDQPVTFYTRIKTPATVGATNYCIFSTGGNSAFDNKIDCFIDTLSRIQFRYIQNNSLSTSYRSTSDADILSDTIYDLFCTNDGAGNLKIYYQSVDKTATNFIGGITTVINNDDNFVIGSIRNSGISFYEGLIQQNQIVDFVLSDAQRAAAESAGTVVGISGVSSSNILLNFNANKELPDVPTDDSDNAYPITVNGGLSYSPFENA